MQKQLLQALPLHAGRAADLLQMQGRPQHTEQLRQLQEAGRTAPGLRAPSLLALVVLASPVQCSLQEMDLCPSKPAAIT